MQTNPIAIQVDSYNFIKTLTESGVDEKQAKAHLDNILKINFQNVASKDDIDNLKSELKEDIANLKFEMKSEISRLDVAIERIKNDIIRWIVPLILGLYAFVAYKH